MSWIADRLFGTRDKPYWITQVWGINLLFNNVGGDIEKLGVMLSNPALLKVVSLQCDLFSLGKIIVKDKEGKVIDNDPFVKMMQKPNNMQGGNQFLWDYMFYNMMGNAYLYIDSKIVSNKNTLTFLAPEKMFFPDDFRRLCDKLMLSTASQVALNKVQVRYRFIDGTSQQIPWGNILFISDLSNGLGNWFKGNSRIDALRKIISNSELALDSKNINVQYSGQFLVAGAVDPKDTTKKPLTATEQHDIEEKMSTRKPVKSVKSMIEIKRFVESNRDLMLGESYMEDYFLIGSMYGIPRDVLESAVNGSTYENQEKARGAHISYTLQPKGNELMNKLADWFGYSDQNKSIEMDWTDLPFMQVFENDRALVARNLSIAVINLVAAGASVEDINEILQTDFTKLKENATVLPNKPDVAPGQTPPGQAAQPGTEGQAAGIANDQGQTNQGEQNN